MKIPQLSEKRVRELLSDELQKWRVAILAVRGYYLNTMGKPGQNDVGQFDDAWFLVGPDGLFMAVQANCDPSKVGWNAAIGKPFAMLCPGTWQFIRGPHKGKTPALRQATDDEADFYGIPNNGHFKVWRAKSMDEVLKGKAKVEEGYYAINVHSGNQTTTSSWGCQTAPADRYPKFMNAVWSASKKARQDVIPYKLIDGPVS